MKTTSHLLVSIVLLGAAVLAGCYGVPVSSQSYNDSFTPNQPVKAEGCYDASVFLTTNLEETEAIATKVLSAIDATVTEKTATQIKAQRNRHVGVFVGSGGEELHVTFKPVPEKGTFVAVATKTGFVGGAGQKAWSCQIVDQMVSMAS